METVDIFSHFGLLWMLLYLVKFYPTIGQLIDQQKNIPNNLAVGEFGNLWLVSICWAILFAQPLSMSTTPHQLGNI